MKTPLVHENLGKLLPAVFRDLRATPPFKRFQRFLRRFLPLFAPFKGTLIIYGQKFTLFPKAVCMRLFGGAFSGYARGRFLTMPYRALLASASAPPPCSRKSRYAAIFREIFGFIFYNNLSRKQNHAFALAHLHLRESAFAGKVNAARVIWRALKKARRRGKLRLHRA